MDFKTLICIVLACLPAIIWSYVILNRRDKNFKTYLWIFLGGTLTVFPILGYQLLYSNTIGQTSYDFVGPLRQVLTPNMWYVVLYSFVGITEEFIKFMIVKITDKRNPEIITTLADSLKLGILAALGFAFSENIIYFVRIWTRHGFDGLVGPFIFRSIFTVCAHLIFSGIFSYYYGISKFARDFIDFEKWKGEKVTIVDYYKFRRKYVYTGLFLSMILHAIFNTMLSIKLPNNINILFVILQVAAMFMFLQYLLNQKTGNLTFILGEKYHSTMSVENEEVVLELIGQWYNEKKFKEVIGVCERLLKRDPDNNVVKIFMNKSKDELEKLEDQ